MSQYVNGSYVNAETNVQRILVDPSKPSTFTLQPVATKTATGNGTTVVANSLLNQSTAALGVLVTVVITAAPTGTTPTLVVNLQDAATSGGSYTTQGSSVSLNAAGTYTFFSKVTNAFYRASWTIGGTTPSFKFAVFTTPFKYGSQV